MTLFSQLTHFAAFFLQDYIVQYLIQYVNVPASQIVVGMPSFGRTAVFINESLQAFGVAHNGTGPPGPYTGQQGLLAYYAVCEEGGGQVVGVLMCL